MQKTMLCILASVLASPAFAAEPAKPNILLIYADDIGYGDKGQPYEGAFRVSFAVSWPGKIATGRTSDFLGYFRDVLPTIAEAVGARVPPGVDGICFLPELIGEQAAGPQAQHDYLYWEKGKWVTIRQGCVDVEKSHRE